MVIQEATQDKNHQPHNPLITKGVIINIIPFFVSWKEKILKKFILLSLFCIIGCKREVQKRTTFQNTNLIKADICRESKNTDSAYIYYTKAKEELLNIRDSIEAARAITNIAIIESDKGDYYSSIGSSIQAQKLLGERNDSVSKRIASANYNSIAIASKNLKNFSEAIKYYDLAVSTSINKIDSLAFYNNIGDTYLEQKNYSLAKSYFKKALKTTDSLDYARALNNYAKAQLLDNKNFDAFPDLLKAWQIRVRFNDNLSINSSLATLSDYYSDKDISKSLYFAQEMYKVATKSNSPDDRVEALSKLIILNPKNYSENFKKYTELNSSLQTERNNDINKFGLLKFRVENIEREKAESENSLLIQYLVSGALVAMVIIIIILFSKRQKRLKQEKELEIKNTQLKLSKKVHDVVANGIYQVMTKIENQESFSKDEALDELEFVYEKSRDISYEKTDLTNNEKNFNEKISELIGSFNNDTVKTYLAGNDASIWNGLQESTLTEVYQIVRELLVNMKKHSRADRVVFRFERENELIKIYYTDNGIGIPGEIIYKNGLSSTVSRIETIKGEIIFDTKTERGLKINISFPVS